MNSNLKKKQPKKYQVLNTPVRDKTPSFTRIKNQMPRNNSYILKQNQTNLFNNNNNKYNILTGNNIFMSPYNKEKENMLGISYSTNNIFSNKKINELNNYTTNYTIRDSNFSNISGSAFTNLTYNDLNSKYNYYKVLFHQLKAHNLTLLNQLKKNNNVNELIKSLEKENDRLKNENIKLKEKNDYHANSDGEDGEE